MAARACRICLQLQFPPRLPPAAHARSVGQLHALVTRFDGSRGALAALPAGHFLNRELSRGWTAWHDQYTEGVRKRNLLKQAGARLARPKLTACLVHWRDDWRAAGILVSHTCLLSRRRRNSLRS